MRGADSTMDKERARESSSGGNRGGVARRPRVAFPRPAVPTASERSEPDRPLEGRRVMCSPMFTRYWNVQCAEFRHRYGYERDLERKTPVEQIPDVLFDCLSPNMKNFTIV